MRCVRVPIAYVRLYAWIQPKFIIAKHNVIAPQKHCFQTKASLVSLHVHRTLSVRTRRLRWKLIVRKVLHLRNLIIEWARSPRDYNDRKRKPTLSRLSPPPLLFFLLSPPSPLLIPFVRRVRKSIIPKIVFVIFYPKIIGSRVLNLNERQTKSFLF